MFGTYLKRCLFVTVTLHLLRKLIENFIWKKCLNNIRLDNKIVIVTGANSGIGYETTIELAKRGALVILACRDLKKAIDAVNKIHKRLGFNAKLFPLHLDILSFDSIKAFVKEVKNTFKKVHILINNAGVYYPDTALINEDGIEIHFATHYLGNFDLICLLISESILIEDLNEPSRIINVISRHFEDGEMDFYNWTNWGPRIYSDKHYHNSKLAQLYLNHIIDMEFPNCRVQSYAACPEPTYTHLFHYKEFSKRNILLFPFLFFFLRSAKTSSQTIVYCATAPNSELKNGSIYRNCKQYESRKKIIPTFLYNLWYFSRNL